MLDDCDEVAFYAPVPAWTCTCTGKLATWCDVMTLDDHVIAAQKNTGCWHFMTDDLQLGAALALAPTFNQLGTSPHSPPPWAIVLMRFRDTWKSGNQKTPPTILF